MSTDKFIAPEDMETNEAHLLWDEYKYRHDLIWKHLIRSAIVVITLIALRFTGVLENPVEEVIWAGLLLALGYTLFNFLIVGRELELLEDIRTRHRARQEALFRLHAKERTKRRLRFRARVLLLQWGLFVLVILVGVYQVSTGGTP